jgi:primosomal protein N' (replication factor Y)
MTRSALLAEVAVPLPVPHAFTYLVPDELRDAVVPGSQVRVPFGRREVEGFVVEIASAAPRADLKPLLKVAPGGPVFDAAMLDLTRWVADYYLAPWGEVLRAAIPGGVRHRPGRRRTPPARRDPWDIAPAGLARDAFRPTEEQRAALGEIEPALDAARYAAFLLFGVTGSGKTEVYLSAAARALEGGGAALILVPEISLTAQTVGRFRAWFGDTVAILHSGLTARQRRETWDRARAGGARVILGARSAVFVPLPKLRLVVVDEEHEGAYKQEETPRYHARDVAIVRANRARAVVLLGSATPSLESMENARRGKYRLLKLTERIEGRPRPPVTVVDLRDADRESRAPVLLSDTLSDRLRATLEAKRQAILFLNRRGHSPFVQCRDCGHIFKCPRCDVTLTFHSDRRLLRCHYCNHIGREVEECPGCRGSRFLYRGAGTQRVEEVLRETLPGARIVRLDADTTRRRGSQADLVGAFERGEADILLGTQMVAKGFDFPAVTLVGVLYAEAQLNLPDFRAGERTFQLLTQVAGRAGRGTDPGEVVIQTYLPDSLALSAAIAQDYERFFEEEAAERRELSYPPFSRLVNVLLDGRKEETVSAAAAKTREQLEAGLPRAGPPPTILGPAPMPLTRLKGRYRWHLTVKGDGGAKMREAIRATLEWASSEGPSRRTVRVTVDVDPVTML